MAATLGTVRHVLRRAVVPRGHDAAIDNDDRADAITRAVRTFAHGKRNPHEIPMHVGAIHRQSGLGSHTSTRVMLAPTFQQRSDTGSHRPRTSRVPRST